MIKLPAALAGVALVASACGSDGGDVSAVLPEGEYGMTEFVLDGRPQDPEFFRDVILIVDGEAFSVEGDCLGFGAPYDVVDGRFVADDPLDSSGCLGGNPATSVKPLLVAEPVVEETAPGRVVFRADLGSITFESLPHGEDALRGPTWVVTGISDPGGGMGVSTVGPEGSALIAFEPDGSVSGGMACGDLEPGAIKYSVDDDQISFSGAGASVVRSCDDEVSEALRAVLADTVRFRVRGTSLTLEGGGRLVTLRSEVG